jgi:hypothetical protein
MGKPGTPPPYAAHVVIELREGPTSAPADYYVRVLYQDVRARISPCIVGCRRRRRRRRRRRGFFFFSLLFFLFSFCFFL